MNLEVKWLGSVSYAKAWELQRDIVSARQEGRIENDVLLLLEHPPVYTMGRNGEPSHILYDSPQGLVEMGAEYFEVDRGGSITFHGPGQLVAYPLIDITKAFPMQGELDKGDVVKYLRTLESALIATCHVWGIQAALRPPHTGIWLNDQKIASIGVKISKGITMHGVALNVSTDLTWFSYIIACGIQDASPTSIEQCTGYAPSVEQVGEQFTEMLCRAISASALQPSLALDDLCAAAQSVG